MFRKNRVLCLGLVVFAVLSAPLISSATPLFGTAILGPRLFSVADLNRDGKADLFGLVSASQIEVAVALGNGDGTFQPAQTYSSGVSGHASFVAADVNGDGNPDLIVASDCLSDGHCDTGVVGVLLGNGDGTFQGVQTYASGGFDEFTAPVALVADVNGDGKPDLIAAHPCSSNSNCTTGVVGVLLGNGDGTFQAAQSYASGGFVTFSSAVADVNGDGKPDFIAQNCESQGSGCNTSHVAVLLGNGDGTFQAALVSNVSIGIGSMAVADLNGDGDPDLLGLTSAGAGVSLGNGDGTFGAVQSFGSGGQRSFSIATADMNRDGKPDLILGSKCHSDGNCEMGVISVLLGNGDGTFQVAQTYSSGAFDPRGTILVADVNGDNNPDVLVAECTVHFRKCLTPNRGIFGGGRVGLLLDNSDGTLQTAQIYGSGDTDAFSVTLADVNEDGLPDLLVQNRLETSVKLHTGRMTTSETLSSSLNPSVYGQPVTLTATVSAAILPSGFIRFMNGRKCLGKIPLIEGVATLTTDKLPVGTLTIIALYEPDLRWIKNETAIIQVVNPPSGQH